VKLMDQNNQPQQFPIQTLMALLGPNTAAPAAPQQQPSPQTQATAPQGGAAPGQPAPVAQVQGGMNPVIQSLLGQSQQAMNAPMGQPVPQGGGPINALQHPLVAGITKAIANAAQSYGWTAMMPQERLERTQLQQQKAEALSRLGLAGTEAEMNFGIRQQLANQGEEKVGILQQRANTAEEMAKVQKERADAYDRAVNARADYDKTALQIRQQLGQGRIDEAYKALAEKADDFTRKLEQDRDIAKQNIGIKQTHQNTYQQYVEMLGQIRTAAVQQNNTRIAEQAQQKLAEIQSKNWVQDLFGMAGPATATGAAQAVGMPQGLPSIAQPPSTTPNVTRPTNKGQAKAGPPKPGGNWNPVKGVYE